MTAAASKPRVRDVPCVGFPSTSCAVEYPAVEHAFQAAKTDNPAERERVRQAKTPASAKALGKRVTLRADWDTYRFDVMLVLVRRTFAEPELAALLLAPGDAALIEGNTWRDTTWGCIITKERAWKGGQPARQDPHAGTDRAASHRRPRSSGVAVRRTSTKW